MAHRLLILSLLCGHLFCSVNCSTPNQSSASVAPFLTDLCEKDLLQSLVNKVEELSLNLDNYEPRNLMALKKQLGEVKTQLKLFDSKIAAKCTDKNLKAALPACKKEPSSCTEAMRQENGRYAESGIYQLYLPQFLHQAFDVYCLRDPDGGEPWAIIQRRQSNATDFYRGWFEYEHGFGDFNTNFFLGLNKIHALTHSQAHELWFELADFENEKRFAKYESFAIGNAQDKYELSVLGQYSGTAGDSFTYHRGQKFTTKDSHNDIDDENCAVKYTGAWWYRTCHASNLNGLYLGGEVSEEEYGQGVVWHAWRGHYYSLKYVQMAIRPKYYY
ncbi:microfibril-associated glycoprotein 4-like [Bactrocera dorsalis]|uniref:Microfibril-associated glycoprotein 4-like n=1 Tax=Bactrocera dorsalis TaxID=27457 RepID=A0ABM3J0N0_BACDO|nr:microfibril-associated glycoprotein 4-like [Bactrocera dorsalis]